MTRGQKLIALWLRQRKLRRAGPWSVGHEPNAADYAELARRIDAVAKRVRSGAA